MERSLGARVTVAAGAAALALLAACTGRPEGVGTIPQPPALINIMPDLYAFERAAEGKPPADQVALLKSMVIARHPEIYGKVIAVRSDAALDAYVRRLPAFSEAMRRLEPSLLRTLARSLRDRRSAGGMKPLPPIYVMPSFFNFDGMARPAGTSSVVMFGMDAIAANNVGKKAPDLGPLVSHELFHARHYLANPPLQKAAGSFFAGQPQALHAFVWAEGLATCASRLQNPNSDLADILLSAKLAALPQPTVRKVAAELRDKIDSLSMSDAGRYLLLGGGSKDIPDRTGYLVGMLVADSALERMSLTEAMALAGPELRRETERGLSLSASGRGRANPATACRG